MKRLLIVLVALAPLGCFEPTAMTVASQLRLFETHNVPYQPVRHIPGDSHQRYFKPLVALAASLDVHVLLADDLQPPELWGFHKGGLIVLRGTLSPNGLVATLLHEIGHVVQPYSYTSSRLEREVFAETVSYLVCQRLGLDIGQASLAYMRPNNAEARAIILSALVRQCRQIDTAVAFIMQKLVQPGATLPGNERALMSADAMCTKRIHSEKWRYWATMPSQTRGLEGSMCAQ